MIHDMMMDFTTQWALSEYQTTSILVAGVSTTIHQKTHACRMEKQKVEMQGREASHYHLLSLTTLEAIGAWQMIW